MRPIKKRAPSGNRKLATSAWILAMIAVAPPASAADSLIYVRASSQYGRDSEPSRYHPLNLLDDDPETVWCEGDAELGEGQTITFYFRARQKIDRIVIGPTAKSGRIIEAVRITDGTNSVRVELGDTYVEQRLNSPLDGQTYVVTIERVLGPNKGAPLPPDAACLADMLLYHGGRLFGGRTPAGKLRFDATRDIVLGRWNGPPFGAPESILTFGLDGSWDWVYRPLLGGKGDTWRGEYRFRDNRLLMRRGEAGRWRDVELVYRRVKIDPDAYSGPKGDYDRLTINGEVGAAMAGDYDNAEF